MWREKEAINPLVYNDLEFTDRSVCGQDVSEELPPVDSAQIAPAAKIQKISSGCMYENSLFSCKLMSFDPNSPHFSSHFKRQAVEPTSSHRSAASFVYKTRAPRRGNCLIISVDTFKPALCLPSRPGADVDLVKLEDTFHFLDFDVKTYQNPTAAKILSIIEAESSASHEDADCFACVILTHGDDSGSIYGTDGPVHLDQLIHPFRGNTCPSLAGKPKLFFIQLLFSHLCCSNGVSRDVLWCRVKFYDLALYIKVSQFEDQNEENVAKYSYLPCSLLMTVKVPYVSWICMRLLVMVFIFFVNHKEESDPRASACRGALLDSGTIVSTDSSCGSSESGTLGSLRRIPIEADLLIAYAVQPEKSEVNNAQVAVSRRKLNSWPNNVA
ncbi:hypothetical protein ACTXT7_000981 [Hymenolepis weldensis]